MTRDEIKKVLADHTTWLLDRNSGKRADLQRADLQCADLRGADLRGALLRDALLRDADLRGADLRGADLRFAQLRFADLQCADLQCAQLRGADLRDADLQGAALQGAKLPHFQIPPEKGAFCGYKKLANGVVCELLIPEYARRTSSLVGRKCRAECAYVVSGEGPSSYMVSFIYIVGALVKPNRYDDDIRVDCTNGIHFFITRKEAEEYDV